MEEEKHLLEKATNPVWLRSLIMVALHTGMRRGEILDLKWQNVDLLRRAHKNCKVKERRKEEYPYV